MRIELFQYAEVRPFKIFGLTGSFWTIHLDTLIYTWIAMLLILVLSLIGRYYLKRDLGLVSLAYEKVIGFFINLCNDSFRTFKYDYFVFITTLFFFTLFSCLVGLIPFLDEAAKDLNTTLALGLISFVYVQYQKIRVHGVREFFAEFAEPFFPFAPINIVGELAKIASMAFRLFGNILGGSIILSMLMQLVAGYKHWFLSILAVVLLALLAFKKIAFLKPYQRTNRFVEGILGAFFLLTWAQIIFGIFEVLIQAFVLTMLTTTYLAMGTTDSEAEHEEKEAS